MFIYCATHLLTAPFFLLTHNWMSKVALSIAGKSLSYDLQLHGIAVAILHPGLVQTRMTNFTLSGITPETSVKGLLARIDELTLNNTGSFWHSNGEVPPW